MKCSVCEAAPSRPASFCPPVIAAATSNSWADEWVTATAVALANWAGHSANNGIQSLVKPFGSSTEPDFRALVPTYDRMLAIALMLVGCFVCCALIEDMLGGPQAAGWSVIPRALIA